MRVLFVTPYPPSQVRVRAYGFVRHLARRIQVTVLAPATNERERADGESLRREGVAVKLVMEHRGHQFIRSLRAVSTDQPLQVAFGASPALRAAIAAELASGAYDLLHIEHLRAVGALPDTSPVPVIWDAVDCVSHLFEQGAHLGSSLPLRVFGGYEAQRTRRFEAHQLRHLRHILVTCERDRAMLLQTAESDRTEDDRYPLAEVIALPNGVDQDYFRPHAGARRPETLVFSGKMSYHANVAGALTLAQHILPLIWEQRPNVRAVIAGSNPPLQVRRLARDPRIQVTGYLDDLRPAIQQAQIAVSPLPYASGVQNKILEAMALGTPVVASPSAASGLQAVDQRNVVIADTPAAFAASVLRLLEDADLRESIRTHALEYITAHYNWDDITLRLIALYERSQEMACAGGSVGGH